MSDFLHQLQERLKATKNAPARAQPASKDASGKLISRIQGRFSAYLSNWRQVRAGKPLSLLAISGNSKAPNPAATSKILTYLLMIVFASTLAYWLMRMLQIPAPPSVPTTGITRGMTLYSNQDLSSAYGLFGSKPLVTDSILLRGVVITSKASDGRLDGFAIFEIDGKPTSAISVGENLGKGLSLQSIGDESATLLYEGQKLHFKLSKSGKEKSTVSKK